MSRPDLKRIIHAFVSGRLGYCNDLPTELSKPAVRQLQYIQNVAVWVLTRTMFVQCSGLCTGFPTVRELCLKQLCLYTSNGLAPKYITVLLELNEPPRTLRTSGRGLLLVPRVRTKHGVAAFKFHVVKVWNRLSHTGGCETGLCQFLRILYYFL